MTQKHGRKDRETGKKKKYIYTQKKIYKHKDTEKGNNSKRLTQTQDIQKDMNTEAQTDTHTNG